MHKIIRDNVHGDILISDNVAIELINTPEFQRLRRINQLGGAQFAFTGATHTRFAHCIGVYHLVAKFCSNETFQKYLSIKEILTLKVAGLLHDIGHGPFSHSFEKISTFKHEYYSGLIIKDEKTEVNKIIKKHNLDPNMIADIIEGKCKKNILNLLVSSQLDADRLDFLLRDSLSTGVNYANLDIEWIIRHAYVTEDNKLVFHEKALYAIESYLLGRYHMYKQIYNHKISLGFDATLKMWFKRFSDLKTQHFNFKNKLSYFPLEPLFNEELYDVELYTLLDDYTFVHIIKLTILEDDEILSDLARRLITRDFFTPYWNISIDKAKANLKANNFSVEYYLSETEIKSVDIYKSEDITDHDILILNNKNNKIVPILKKSLVIRAKDKLEVNFVLLMPKINIK